MTNESNVSYHLNSVHIYSEKCLLRKQIEHEKRHRPCASTFANNIIISPKTNIQVKYSYSFIMNGSKKVLCPLFDTRPMMTSSQGKLSLQIYMYNFRSYSICNI